MKCASKVVTWVYAVSPIFTMRRYAYATSLLSPGVCPSVQPSITLVDCIQTAEDITKLLFWPGSPIILVFDPMHRYPIPRETLQWGHKIHGVGKNCDS